METSYTVDRDQRITCVGGSWDAFATQNDGTEAMAEKVIGHSLWDFVAGFEVQSYLNAVLFAVRQKSHEFVTQNRCDDRNTARLFRMTASPLSDGRVKVSHLLLEQPQIQFPPNPKVLKTFVSHSRCSICCSFKIEEDWVDPFAYPGTQFFPSSHVVCPACKGLAREGLGEVVQMPLRKKLANPKC